VIAAGSVTSSIGAANTKTTWRRKEQMKIIGPLTVLLILLILFALYGNLKFPMNHLL